MPLRLSTRGKVDYAKFIFLTKNLESYRTLRLIGIDKFNHYVKDENTIILDTRSRDAYEDVHLKGAVNLPFSDFTAKKLAALIPSKSSRILIYCNNNFESNFEALANKDGGLALNIPTFINLNGYGYLNVYELDGYFKDYDDRLDLVISDDLDF